MFRWIYSCDIRDMVNKWWPVSGINVQKHVCLKGCRYMGAQFNMQYKEHTVFLWDF